MLIYRHDARSYAMAELMIAICNPFSSVESDFVDFRKY